MGQGNVFTGVYDSVHIGGLPQYMLGYPPPPEQTPPPQSRGSRSPPEQTPPGSRHPLPPDQTHPSGSRPPQREADSGIRSTSGRYASYWNAFLYLHTAFVCNSPQYGIRLAEMSDSLQRLNRKLKTEPISIFQLLYSWFRLVAFLRIKLTVCAVKKPSETEHPLHTLIHTHGIIMANSNPLNYYKTNKLMQKADSRLTGTIQSGSIRFCLATDTLIFHILVNEY